MTFVKRDTRKAQADRLADYMQMRPHGATIKELDSACDPGSCTKLLSVMRKRMGFVIRVSSERAMTAAGTRRTVKRYFLVSRPGAKPQAELFPEGGPDETP